MTIRIERALPEDATELANLHAQALPPGWSAADLAAFCRDKHKIVLKAASGGRLPGFTVLQFAADEAEILTLAVSEEARRQGMASLMLRTAIESCERKLISRLYLEVAEGNGPAIKLYAKAGFSIIARRENYYQLSRSAPETALIMRLDTKAAITQIGELGGSTL
jgi:[ribosomal protein S18]-alanine N-acetyltransferase